MDSRTHLDYALFQLTPTRTRCDLVVFSGGKSEKLASGLVEPFISHLKFAKDQIPKGGYSITLRPPNTHASWFTKAIFQRLVRFISTPEILERFVRIEREILQIEDSIQSNELSNADVAANAGEGTMSAANDGIAKRSPDSSKFKGKSGTRDAAEDENSKICLQRTLETRKVLLRKEQAMAYARALVAGFEMDNMDDLILFADTFGASRLRDACHEFKELCKTKLTDALWMDELAAMAACPPSELPYLGTSGIILTSDSSQNNIDASSNLIANQESPNKDNSLPASDQMSSTPAKVQVQMPWPNQIPPYMYNYQSPVQGYPFQGMQPVPPYYPGHMHWTQNMDDPSHGPAREYRHRQKSSSRKKEKSLDVKGSETSEEEEEQIESGDSDSGSDSDAVKKQDGEHSSGEKPITKKHRKRSSKTVVIRNINYITSDKRNGEKGGVSEGDLSDEGEFIDGDYLKQKVYDAVGSLEKHRKSKSHGHKNKGANRGSGYGNGSNGLPDGDLENDQTSDGGKRNDWDALQNLLMRDDDSTINGVKEQQTVDVQGENLLNRNSDNGVPFENGNAIDLGNEKGTMRRTRTTTNDSFILTERVGGNEGRGKLEDFADAEVSRPMMNRGDSADTQLLISRSMEESGISGQRTVSDFLPESSTIRKVTGEDWFVMNQSTKSENQDSTMEQAMFGGDYALSTHKEASKNIPTIDDSFMVQTRSSADDQYNSHWRTDISMVEDSSVVSQPEIVTQDVSQAKKSGAYEPDDLCVMLERNSGLSPGASWAPEMDYETEISFTKSDKKSAPVEMNNPTEERPLANGRSPSSKKAVGPGTNNLGKEARSKVLRGSLATSRSDILSKSKSRPTVHKSKFEKEEEIRKRMEDSVIERQKRIAERSAASGASPAASKRIPVGSKKSSPNSGKDQVIPGQIKPKKKI